MGLMDKAKQQATKLAEKSREAGEAARQKVGEVQEKRRADSLYRDLGEVVYAERTGKASGETAAEIERLISELRQLEADEAAGE